MANKITTSHGTKTDATAEVINLIHDLPSVSKISLGEIRHVTGGRRDIKFSPMNGGVKVVVRGNGAIQHMYIYTKEPDQITKLIEDNFNKSP